MNDKLDELAKTFAQSVTRRQALKKFGLSLALGCATLCLATPLRAGQQVPFKGNFSFTIVLATPIDATHVLFDVDVHVQATQLGKAQGPGRFILDLAALAYVGEAAWAAANGDEVSSTFAGQFVPTDTPGLLENVEIFEIVGGTGRFEGATGAGIGGGQVEVDAAGTLMPLFPAPFVGTISSPGSLKK